MLREMSETMSSSLPKTVLGVVAGVVLVSIPVAAQERVPIRALGIPLADHYAAVVAFERYRDQMEYADFQLEILPGPDLVRARFREDDVDMAFNVCPMVMDMFSEEPNFRWISLIHRDGNALAVNRVLDERAGLDADRHARQPDARVAEAVGHLRSESGEAVECAVPHFLATHTVVLYKYLRDHEKSLGFGVGFEKDVVAVEVAPPRSPSFIKKQNSRALPAAFEQSLPWPEMAEVGGHGRVAWYSKDVMAWEPHGHVECVIIAKDEAIAAKRAAIQEVVRYIHQAGQDIERTREKGGAELEAIVEIIRRRVPDHTREAIVESLRADLMTINYSHLNVDEDAKGSLRAIMELALEAGILKRRVDIDAMADVSFRTELTER